MFVLFREDVRAMMKNIAAATCHIWQVAPSLAASLCRLSCAYDRQYDSHTPVKNKGRLRFIG
jgi:hypothetical protein